MVRDMTVGVWTAFGLVTATLGLLAAALFQLRTEIRTEFAGSRAEIHGELGEFRAEFRGDLVDLRREMREGFAHQGERIDHLAARIDAHIDRHAG